MSRILLIKPPVSDNSKVVQVSNPPVGLMALAAYLRDLDRSRKIRIVDMILEELSPDGITSILSEFQPDICGISCLTMGAKNALHIAERIKTWNRDCHVLVGGPHPTFMPESVLKSKDIDYVVMGEGERAAHELILAIENHGTTESIAGIGYRSASGPIINDRAIPIDITTLPQPAYDLIDVRKYFASKIPPHSGRLKYPEYMTIMSSRACPYGCIYCHNIFGKKFRAREPEDFVEELVMLNKDYGVKEYHVIDDVFNLQRERTLRICELIKQRLPGVALAFPNGLRTDLLDKEVLFALKQAGMYYFAAAIESGSPEMQKLVGKKLNIEKASAAIDEAGKMGIIVHGFFMMGFPGETEAQLKMTINYAKRSSLNTAGFFAVTAYPKTKLYEMAKHRGVQIPDDFDQYNYHYHTLNLTAVSLPRLRALRKMAYWKFYADPMRILKIITMTPRKTDILKNLKIHIQNFF